MPLAILSAYYRLTVRVLYFLCGQSWFHNLTKTQKKRAAMLDLFLKETKYPSDSWQEIKRKSLLVDLVEYWWGTRLIDVAPIIVEGREFAELGQSAHQGIIFARLHQKYGGQELSSALPNWLSRQEFKPLITIGVKRKSQRGELEKFANASEMVEAYRILRKGGAIQVLPDGYQGIQAINIEFKERARSFRTGFAELAIATGAQVIPISLRVEMDGTVVIKISPALRLADNLPDDKKIPHLINQYVQVLDEFWKTAPYMIVYRHVKKHVQLEPTPK